MPGSRCQGKILEPKTWNLESEKGFLFFQNFKREQGILEELKRQGISEGDTVRVYGHEFDYYED